jgi:hypothetical protein
MAQHHGIPFLAVKSSGKNVSTRKMSEILWSGGNFVRDSALAVRASQEKVLKAFWEITARREN